jgi:hypothetical protein
LDITEWNFMGRVITARRGGVHSWWNVHETCRICAWNLLLLSSERRAFDGFLAFLLRLFASISVFLVVSLLQGWWCREGKGDDKNDVLVKKKKVQEKPCQKNHGIEGRF